MRILHVQPTLSPRYGGPATVLPALAKAQSQAGHEVVIATTNADHRHGTYHEPGWDTLGGADVRVFFASVQFEPLLVSLGLASFLRRVIPAVDVVVVHGIYRFPTTFAAFLARRVGTPYIVRPHGSLDPYLYARSTTGKLRLKRMYERWFDLPNLRAADAIHYTAGAERQRASFLNLRSPSFVVPNGLDWESYKTLPVRGALRARLGVGDAPVVLFLGRLHPKKGLDILIPAFGDVLEREPNAQLVIAGPDNHNHEQQVRAWVSERGFGHAVRFVGPLYGGDVVQAFVDADVFVLPSYTENFGMTVVEAMACALPVVISDQVNIHTEISSAAAGSVTHCDAGEVAEAVSALLRDASRRRVMGQAGRRLAQERYSWPAIIDALTKEYEGVIARHKGASHTRRRDRV